MFFLTKPSEACFGCGGLDYMGGGCGGGGGIGGGGYGIGSGYGGGYGSGYGVSSYGSYGGMGYGMGYGVAGCGGYGGMLGKRDAESEMKLISRVEKIVVFEHSTR
uniref:Uncharacterized protein n=1 Tax=Panagrolaimus sp. PS1159 TaxID=55785 RepID=A0AC35FMU5_9BILA